MEEQVIVEEIEDGFPDPRIAPIEQIVREYRRLGKSRLTNRLLNYGPEQGSYRLRVELAKYLNRTRGMQISEKEILITKGTQMAIYLTAQLLVRRGDTVFVPEPGYMDANRIFKLLLQKYRPRYPDRIYGRTGRGSRAGSCPS